MEDIKVCLRRSEAQRVGADLESGQVQPQEQVPELQPAPLFRTRLSAAFTRPRMPSMFRFSNLTNSETIMTEWPAPQDVAPQDVPPVPRPSSSRYGPTPRTANFDINSPVLPCVEERALGLDREEMGTPARHRAWTPRNEAPQLFGEVLPQPPAAFMPPFRPTPEAANQPLSTEPENPRKRKERSKKSSKKSGKRSKGTRHRHHTEAELKPRRRRPNKQAPRNFLGCLPWVKSRRVRSQIVHCVVSGLFLSLLLIVYVALSLTNNITSSEFNVFVILIVLTAAAYFCGSVVRLCLLVTRRRKRRAQRLEASKWKATTTKAVRNITEDGGIEAQAAALKVVPPAYGEWRGSIRVDPQSPLWNHHTHPKSVASLNAGADDIGRNDWKSNIHSPPAAYHGAEHVPYMPDKLRDEHTRQPPGYDSDTDASDAEEPLPQHPALRDLHATWV